MTRSPAGSRAKASSQHTDALNGVTTGSVQMSEKRIRSMVDRLGKAARKAAQGEAPSAWLMVGRIQEELRTLLTEGDELGAN